ncbi:MAG: hypothetical protein AMS23_10285, partial [Bacteroides sp. SM1_62]
MGKCSEIRIIIVVLICFNSSCREDGADFYWKKNILFYNNEIVGFVSSNSTEGIEFKDYIEEISFGLFK